MLAASAHAAAMSMPIHLLRVKSQANSPVAIASAVLCFAQQSVMLASQALMSIAAVDSWAARKFCWQVLLHQAAPKLAVMPDIPTTKAATAVAHVASVTHKPHILCHVALIMPVPPEAPE